MALLGSVSSITTLFIATFSVDMNMMLVFYSILGGPCLAMIWISSQLIIGYYFESYRPIANGISCSGAGAGLLIFSYMNSQLIPRMGWRNTSRLHIVFLLVCLFMSFTFLEVKPTRVGKIKPQVLF